MLPDYKSSLFCPVRFRHVHFIVAKLVVAGDLAAAGTITVDADESSPQLTITRGGVGQFTLGLPKGQWLHPVGPPLRLLAEFTAVSFAGYESISASAGTATFETSAANGTAADPATGEVIYLTLMLGRA